MSDILVTNIVVNDKKIASFYDRWDALTIPTLERAESLLNYMSLFKIADMSERELQLAFIRYAEKVGGGIETAEYSSEFGCIQSLFPNESFKENITFRSGTLVAITEPEMANFAIYALSTLTLDFTNKKITHNSGYEFNSIEEVLYEERVKEDEVDKILSLPPEIKSVTNFDFSEFIKISELLKNYAKHNIFTMKVGDKYFSMRA